MWKLADCCNELLSLLGSVHAFLRCQFRNFRNFSSGEMKELPCGGSAIEKSPKSAVQTLKYFLPCKWANTVATMVNCYTKSEGKGGDIPEQDFS